MAKGKVELLVAMVGQDQLSATLKRSQGHMRKLGKETKRAANESKQFGKLRSVIGNMARGWEGLHTKIGAVSAGIMALRSAFTTVMNHIVEGEDARNVEIVFQGLAKNAEEAAARASAAVGGTVTDTDIKKMIIRVQSMGGTIAGSIDLMRAAFRASQAGIGDFKSVFERLMMGIVGGRTTTLKLAGVMTDMNKALKDYADKRGISLDRLTKEEQMTVKLSAVTGDLEKLYRQMGIRFGMMTSGGLKFKAMLSDLESDMQVALVGGLKSGVKSSSALTAELKKTGPVTQALQVAFYESAAAVREHGEEAEKYVDISGYMTEAEIEEAQAKLNAAHSAKVYGEATKKLGEKLEELGVDARDAGTIISTFNIDIITDLDGALDKMEQTTMSIDQELEKLEISARDAALGITGAFELPGQVAASSIMRMAEAASGADQSLQDMFNAADKAMEKGAKGGKKRTGKSGSGRREAERALWAEHAQKLADIKGEIEGEEHRHSVAIAAIGKERFKLKETRQKKVELEELRHTESMKRIRETGTLAQQIKKEEQLLAEFQDAQAASRGPEITESRRHRLAMKQIRSTEFIDQRALNAAIEMEKTRHKAAMSEIEQSDFARTQEQADAALALAEQNMMAHKALMDEGYNVAISRNSDLQSLSQESGDDFQAVASTLAAASAQTAKDFEALAKGSPAAINALGAVTAGAIRDVRAQSAVKSAFAFAEGTMMMSQGNVIGGSAAFVASALYAAIAGKSGGKK